MKSVFLLFCLVLCGFCTADELNQDGFRKLEQQDCGGFKDGDLTLINNEVKIGSRPWMALFKIQRNTDRFPCIGTLISDRFVLTVAHCVKDHEVNTVRLGEHDQGTEQDCRTYDGQKKCQPSFEDVDVERVIVHKDYKDTEHDNDIALLQLARKVDFKEHIRPICLPLTAELQQKVETLESMLQTAWGVDNEESSSDLLREVELPRMDRQNCSAALARWFDVKPNKFCSSTSGILCRGTSGGPMSKPVEFMGKQRFVQFGIVSAGISGCTKGTAQVNTNIASYLPWITQVIAEAA